MIEQLRADIAELNEEIQQWYGEIEQLNEQIEDAQAQISDKEIRIEELQNESHRNELIEIIQNSDLSIEQLETIVANINNNEMPRVVYAEPGENRVTTHGIDSDNVTYDMLTDEMHNATITLVGVKYQDLWNVHNRSPEIGDIITLAKRDGIDTQSTVGYTEDGISIGILPAREPKLTQLRNIGATIVNNHDVHLGDSIFDRNYKVVGVIPAAFIFLDPIYDEAENIEETVAEAVSQIDSERHRLVHTAINEQEARQVFNEEMPNHCSITNVVEQDDVFIINYENHRANTTAEYYKTCEVERAE